MDSRGGRGEGGGEAGSARRPPPTAAGRPRQARGPLEVGGEAVSRGPGERSSDGGKRKDAAEGSVARDAGIDELGEEGEGDEQGALGGMRGEHTKGEGEERAWPGLGMEDREETEGGGVVLSKERDVLSYPALLIPTSSLRFSREAKGGLSVSFVFRLM